MDELVDPAQPVYDIACSADGRVVWVTAADGSCVGRFDKRAGIDVHRTVSEQMAGQAQCLYCTHTPAGPADWAAFRQQVLAHHGIDVPSDFITFT